MFFRIIVGNIEPTTNDDVVSDRRFVAFVSRLSSTRTRYHISSSSVLDDDCSVPLDCTSVATVFTSLKFLGLSFIYSNIIWKLQATFKNLHFYVSGGTTRTDIYRLDMTIHLLHSYIQHCIDSLLRERQSIIHSLLADDRV